MKRTVLAFAAISALFSCNKVAQPPFTREEVKQKADSISSIRIMQADKQAKTDLEYRMKIEVKVKVDSILQASIKDTAKKLPRGLSSQLPKAQRTTRAGSN